MGEGQWILYIYICICNIGIAFYFILKYGRDVRILKIKLTDRLCNVGEVCLLWPRELNFELLLSR